MISGLTNTNSAAQQTEPVSLDKYTQSQGLSSYNIRKIIQDKYGFIWIATQDGLNRFDGQSFVVYNKNLGANRRLSGADIRTVIEDKDHDFLWVLTDQGINKINTVTANVEQQNWFRNPVNQEWNVTMTLLNNEIWVGTFTGLRIYNVITKQALIVPNISDKNTTNEVRNIFTDHYNNVWVCVTGVGIKIFNGQSKKLIKTIPNTKFSIGGTKGDITYWNSVEVKQNEILFATSIGLRSLKYDAGYNIIMDNGPSKCFAGLNTTNVQYVSKGNDNQLYISSNSGLFRLDENLRRYTLLTEQSGTNESEWLNAVFCTFSDKYSNLWLGCQEGLGFIKAAKNPFKAFYKDPASGIKLEHVLSLSSPHEGEIYAGLRNGFVRINETSHQFVKLNSKQTFQHNYTDPFGKLQASYPRGIYVYNNSTWLPVSNAYPEFKKVYNYAINSHIYIKDSLLVMGTENDKGLLVWNYKKRHVNEINIITQPALATNIINTIYLDKKENIWALADNAITILDKDLSKPVFLSFYDKQNKQPYNIYFDICEAKSDYWVAAYGTGIMQLGPDRKLKRIYSTKDGLSNAGVYKIFPVGDSVLVITSNNGLSVMNLNTKKFQNYYQQDGLHSDGFEEACGFMKNGLIYAGGIKGFTIIDPSLFKTNTVPPAVYINRITTERDNGRKDTSNIKLKILQIANNTLQTSLYFSGINYTNPNRTVFAYRILEQNKNWVNIGNRNFINLIGLLPNTYTIQVKASNEDNYWSNPTEITLVYLPKWYQTEWFKTLIVLCLIALGYFLYLMRIKQLMKEHKIREDIAGDLHDDIGSTLNSIKIFTHLALTRPEKTEYLENINKNLESAIIGLRDLIWVLDDKRDTIADFLNRLQQHLLPITNAIDIKLKLIYNDPAVEKPLNKTEKRYLYFIAKEAINNSIKYADCTEIVIEFKAIQKLNMLTIKDNGQGFDVTETSDGYGLKNMRTRALQINYNFNITSIKGLGTNIEIVEKRAWRAAQTITNGQTKKAGYC
jgi:signal transduction histidine kinase/ligand-binding sensor domain-containing protein